jgi:hypothetical protein
MDSVKKMLQKFELLGLVKREVIRNEKKVIVKRFIYPILTNIPSGKDYPTLVEKISLGGGKVSPTLVENFPLPSGKNYPERIDNRIDNRKEKRERELPSENLLEDLPLAREIKKDKPYSSQSFLLSLDEETISEFLENFNCSRTQIIKKAQDLYDWCETNGKRKKNHKSFLRSALRKDYGDKQKPLKPEDDLEEFIRRLKIRNEMIVDEATRKDLPKNEL